MNSFFTLEPFTILDHTMADQHPPDLAGDSSMSTAALEDDVDTLICDFGMPYGASPDLFCHSSIVTPPSFKSVSATLQGEHYDPLPIVPSLDPLYQLEPTPIFQSLDTSNRSVSSDATCANKSAAELDQLCKEGIEKLRESMKRSSLTRQEVMRQRKLLGF